MSEGNRLFQDTSICKSHLLKCLARKQEQSLLLVVFLSGNAVRKLTFHYYANRASG